MGTYVPASLLGTSGYLSKKQANLESLLLTTNSYCLESKTITLDLTTFHRLKEFSWRNINILENFHNLLNILQTNSKHLKRLELSFSSRKVKFELIWTQNGLMFPSLQILSLSYVYFTAIIPEITLALNISGLQSVSLNHCPAIQELLRAIIRSGQQIRFISLKLTIWYKRTEDLKTVNLLAIFLQSFKSLVNLYLLFNNGPQIDSGFWKSVLHHRHTLRRLVYYKTNLQPLFDRTVLP